MLKVVHVDAEDLFLGKLKGVSDSEKNRTIIGNTFIKVCKLLLSGRNF